MILRRLPSMASNNRNIRPGEVVKQRKLKVGFLFNHDELHQVAHTAPIISPLRNLSSNLTVDIIASSEEQVKAVFRHLDPDTAPPAIHLLRPSKTHELAEKLAGRSVPLGRIGCLKANLDLFSEFDALIVPETTSTRLKTRLGLAQLKLIFLPHGAGDRSVSVCDDIAYFDFVMLPGEKTRTRMLEAGIVREDNSTVVGYPKLESRSCAIKAPIFANDRPTVLYNPHFDPKLSSWFDFGIPILEHFAEQEEFNLIVAPHVMLFRRKVLASTERLAIKLRREIPRRFFDIDHIHIDTGSLNSVDMTYTRMADIYVGDVSSQIYEFISEPRPAIFLNSHVDDWQGDPNYAFWNFGPVIDHMRDFDMAMRLAFPSNEHFAARQSRAFKQTIDTHPEHPSATRAAKAVSDYLRRQFPSQFGDND